MKKFTRLFLVLMLSVFLFAAYGCGDTETTEDTSAPVAGVAADANVEDATIAIENATVYFTFDSFVLNDDAKAKLETTAQFLKAFSGLNVQVEGHCDARGTEEYNLALGEKRAKAAYDYMVMLGVNPDQLTLVSYGEMHPAVQGDDESAWNKNRRDEFRVSAK